MNNYIIGGGITGLLLLEMPEFKDYKLLTDRIGGQLTETNFNLGPRILQYSTKVQKFLLSIGITKKPKEFRNAYSVNERLKLTINDDEKLNYFMKTRGHGKINKTFLSEGKTLIIGWDINEINLIDVLYKRNKERIMFYPVNSINVEDKTIGSINCYIGYDNLVSTVDLQGLFDVMGIQIKLYKNPVYYYYVKKKEPDLFDMNNLDYVYDITDKYSNRITKIDNNYRVIESNYGGLDFEYYEIEKAVCFKTQIATELKLKDINGIKLVGRYAQYDHSIKANNVIDKYFEV